MQIARDFEALPDEIGIEVDLRKDRGVRAEEDRRARAARGPSLLQRADHRALLEAHLPLRAVAPDGRDQLLRQRVDDAGADAVESAGGLVVAGLELAAGMQRRENHLERALLRLRMLVDRNAATVVCDCDRGAVLVQCDGDVRGIAVHRLVYRVVEDLPDEVVQAGAADAADVHARALADGFEAFEDGDVFRGVSGRHSVQLIVSQDVSMPDGGVLRTGRALACVGAYNTRMAPTPLAESNRGGRAARRARRRGRRARNGAARRSSNRSRARRRTPSRARSTSAA